MLQQLYKGILLATLIGVLSYFLSPYIPGVNGVLMSFILGVIISNAKLVPTGFKKGISFSGSKILEFSIVLLAFNISFGKIAAIGASNFAIIAIMIVSVLLLTVFLAKKLNCPTSGGWLVGFGTAICGSSAIAALSPMVAENEEDTGIAIAIVNLLGSIGMISLPLALTYFKVSEVDSGVFLGASLHSVGNVAGAGYGMSSTIGDSAITIKLARVALLSPALIFFNILTKKNSGKGFLSYFKLPLFLWAFIAITVLVSIVPFPESFLNVMKTGGSILLIIAMAAIGLKVSLKQLLVSGQKAMKFGLLIFILQILILVVLLAVL